MHPLLLLMGAATLSLGDGSPAQKGSLSQIVQIIKFNSLLYHHRFSNNILSFNVEIFSHPVRVLSANLDGMQRGDTWAKRDGMVTLSGDSTICLRFNIAVFRLQTSVLYLFNKGDQDVDSEFLGEKCQNSSKVCSVVFVIS